MFGSPLSWYIVAYTLFDLLVKTHLTVHDSSHGFINHEKYLVDDMGSYHEGFSVGTRSPTKNDLNFKYLLKFEPEILDFKQRPLGVPHLEKVTVHNVHKNRSIDMTSISGNTVHFHSSFFEDKKIPPLGNTTFNVVFLGREEGAIESDLFIHTTEGRFKYQVKGGSVYSPYRLRPIVGVKLPLNATFSPFIYMHNPHAEPIQIVEVYSSGGDFHLELPTGELEGPRDMWEIAPLQTKAVIRVRFHARTEQNHTAYVRIKLNNTEEVLVVPLEVQVTSSAGLYEPQGCVDFGVGGSLHEPKKVKLYMQNPLKKPIRVHSVTSASKAIKIEFETVRIPADSRGRHGQLNVFPVGTLTLDWLTAFETKDFSGKIIVKYRNGKGQTEIPYYITVLEGGLSYDPLATRYFINEKPEGIQLRSLRLKNDFLVPVMVRNVSLAPAAQNYFQLSNFKTSILKPHEEKIVVSLKLKPGVSLTNVMINSNILIRTNISDILIPLLSYNGKLELLLPYKNKDNSLDLGTISVQSKKDAYFLVLNKNPVPLAIKQLKTSIPSSSTEVIGCGSGNHTLALLQDNFDNLSKCASLRTNHYAIIRLTVQSFNSEGQIWGDITIETQYEQMSIPVQYKIAQGRLEIGPDRLVFDQCFPGKICSHPIKVHSSFHEPMMIESIQSVPPDPRLSCKHTGHILARTTKVIGHLYLDPMIGCVNECYSGLTHDSTAQWLKTLTLTEAAPEFDLNMVNTFYNRYLNQTQNGLKKWQNITMKLDTSEVRAHTFKTRVKMSWPSLLADRVGENKTVFNFPLTQVGNVTYTNITLKNPASVNLVIQIVLDTHYPGLEGEGLYEGLSPNLISHDLQRKKKRASNTGFFLHESYKQLQAEFGSKGNLDFHKQTVPILLKPGENVTFTVGFKADEPASSTAALFLRNTLTILEILKLNARAAHPSFKFGNRKPGSAQPLAFELTEKHLKDCEREIHRKYPSPNLTVKRSFTARNTGDITVYVKSFVINEMPCEGYGFKVLNCEAFYLLPNATRKIDIAFTPDFTLAKITRTLVLETSLNLPVNYTLVTTIPPYYLSLCSTVILRPAWEAYMYYTAVCLMCFLVFFVALGAIMDSERIVNQALGLLITRNCPSTQPTLDLRLVGQQTRTEIRQKVEADVVEQQKNKACSKICSLMDEPVKPAKQEAEKHTVLVPAVGKHKRKAAKRMSGELGESCEKKSYSEPHRVLHKTSHKQTETARAEVFESEPAKKHSPKEHRKQHSKRVAHKSVECSLKPIEVVAPACEEETSSTTTESSNNEEEKQKLTTKVAPLKKQTSPKVDCGVAVAAVEAVNTSADVENAPTTPAIQPEPLHHHARVERKRSGSKNKSKDYTHEKSNGVEGGKVKSNRNARERKEKQTLTKKLSKPISSNNNLEYSSPSSVSPPILRTSPSIPSCSFWSENKATFSDIVARTENNTYPITTTTRSSYTQPTTATITKPTVYVEPYKQTNTDLGPIGSRKFEFWQDSAANVMNTRNDDYNQISSVNSNSFFTDTHSLGLESPDPFLEFNTTDTWEQQPLSTSSSTSLLDLMRNNILCSSGSQNSNSPLSGTWNATNGHWDTPYTHTDDAAARTSQSGFLWGSSPVWQPLIPQPPKSPPRTPPGFMPQRESDERPLQNDVYNPFDISKIWTHQQPSRWDFQQHEQ